MDWLRHENRCGHDANTLMAHVFFATAIGTCGLAWNEAGLTGFTLPENEAHHPESRRMVYDPSLLPTTPPDWVAEVIARVQSHLAGQAQDFAGVRYDFSTVSEFQRRVYCAALTVKAGQMRSYGDLAAALGLPPGGARAIGAALGSNPWPLLVPCHRFVGADGKMTGFSGPGGVRTKTRLLTLEGAQLLSE